MYGLLLHASLCGLATYFELRHDLYHGIAYLLVVFYFTIGKYYLNDFSLDESKTGTDKSPGNSCQKS